MLISSVGSSSGAPSFAHPPPRPSTSPVPNFFTGPSSTSAGGRKTTASQFRASQALQAQAAANVRLRPLPPSSNARPGASAFGNLMMIEGRTTGEEIERSAVERRELPAALLTSATAATAAGRTTPSVDASEAEKAKQRARKLEADLRKANDQLKRKTAEVSALENETRSLNESLAAAQRSLELADKASSSALHAKDAEADRLRQENSRLARELEAAKAEALRVQKSASESSALQHATASQAWASEKSALQATNAEATKEADTQRRRADLLQSQLDGLRIDLAAANRRADDEKLARQRSDAVNVARMAELEREAEQARIELAVWRERIKAVDSFVLEICQPQFAVVKDESLAPMNADAPKGSPDSQGFVLVPLQLLLQGYALLPGDKKKSIAERYEATKAGRA